MSIRFLNTAMYAAESGRLPDSAVRLGIRTLLRQRLRSLRSRDDTQRQRLRQFMTVCRQSQIAELPDLANEQHYELPPEFFQTVLGHHLKYSCCHWPHGVSTLDEAEDSALKLTCERGGIADGMQILELGCGWGALSLWMAERYPNSRIVAVSNSASQRTFIEQRAQEIGLTNLTVLTADMNTFAPEQHFDRVVSIEMFEHMRNHEELMRRIATWLKPDGLLFVHIFCHLRHAYLFEADGPHNWMGRHFFSGGMMPSEELLPQHQRDLSLVDQWRWNGRHYQQTCEAWLERQNANRTVLRELFADTYGPADADRWLNRWRMFFMACAELFGYLRGNEWFVSHYLFAKR